MPDEPNKPAGEFDGSRSNPASKRQAVRNQGEARPDDYPDKAGGKDAIGASSDDKR